ncbi:MAG TPA: dihydrodipicolinate reductase C-terminal domain-containing protein [Gemmatimonadaceae bacterium]|nr:dihydrodipicolinate reductase C-terminal domain-containing protein [Gemmatimonadaceae bacterium]
MSAPRLALVGTGKMGRAVRALAQERGWPVVAEIGAADNPGGAALTRDRLAGAEVAVEFTTPAAAPDNAIACARAGVPVVVGTTGWLAERERVAAAVREAEGALFWAPNFSVGVHVFWRVAEYAAALMARLPAFDAHIVETHHAAKQDAPSGTALELQRRAAAALGRPIPATSVRVGAVPGTHELLFDGAFEQLRLTHEARDRRTFAEGALLAAGWLAEAWGAGRRGIFTMDDLLQP